MTEVSLLGLKPSLLVQQQLDEIKQRNSSRPVLDLACGNGRNGLFLAKHGKFVEFADINPEALFSIDRLLVQHDLLGKTCLVDFEQVGVNSLQDKHYCAILVFRYLHRPLLSAIKSAIEPGGLILYETFTCAQAAIGRPKNPDFLLQQGELRRYFDGWDVKHYFEGVRTDPKQAIAQICAKKPN